MADVYVARQQGTGGFEKIVALKLLREHLVDNPEFRAMFLEEARTTGLLTHPGIVQTFDAGEIAGRAYMAMEFVQGEPLGRFERAVRRREGGFPVPLALSIVRDVAIALDYAHTLTNLHGVPLRMVHRDVSPSNIMVTQQGGVKLLDFGIAKVATKGNATQAGTIKGKFAYLSPEQAAGASIDSRSDTYSLGIVLWQMLTGKKAFEGENDLELLRAVVSSHVMPPSAAGADCEPELDLIVMRAMARNPEERYATAQDFATELSAHLATIAPGYSATNTIRAAMETYFGERGARLSELLQQADAQGIELGAEDIDVLGDQVPSIVSTTGPSGSRSRAKAHSQIDELDELPVLIDTGASKSSRLAVPPAEQGRRRLGLVAAVVGTLLVAGLAALGVVLFNAPDTRTITISSEPSGARVLVSGRSAGTTPLELTVPTDRAAHLSLERLGYAPWTKVLEAGSESSSLTAQMERADVVGTLLLRSEPPGAAVQIDGVALPSTTPAVVPRLWIGEPHEVVVTLAGYEPAVEQVSFEQAGARTLVVSLVAASSGLLDATCAPEPCVLWVDGERAGATPIERHPVPVGRELALELRQGDRIVQSERWSFALGQQRALSFSAAGPAVARAQPQRWSPRGRGDAPVNPAVTVAAAAPPVETPEPVVAQPAGPIVRPVLPVPHVAPPLPLPVAARPTTSPVIAAATPTARVTPTARIGTLSIDGTIDRTRLRRVVRELEPRVTRCYADAYARGAFEGELLVRFVISGSGRPGDVSATGDAATRAGACIRGAFSSGSYPASTASDTVVRAPIRLQAR